MSISVVPLLLAAGLAASPHLAPVTPDEAVASLRACGFSEVSARYEDELQDHVLVIEDPTVGDEQIACAARTYLTSGYWTEVPKAIRPRYFEHYDRLSTEWSKQESLRELEARGELRLLPAYEVGKTNDLEFAQKLEGLCGDHARGMLQSEYGPHSVNPEWALNRQGSLEQLGEPLMCVSRFAAAAGFKLNFIGNEKVAEPSTGQ